MPVQFAFSLVPDPVTPSVVQTNAVEPTTLTPVSTGRKAGLKWPFRVMSDGNPELAYGDELRMSRIGFVLGTRASGAKMSGEIPSLMRLGSQFYLLLNTSFTIAREQLAIVYAQQALAKALPDEQIVQAREVVDRGASSVSIELATQDKKSIKSRPLKVLVPVVKRK